MLTFDEPTHTYRFGGRVVPSVTQHLQALHSFGFLTDEELEIARARGDYTHKLTEIDDQHGDLHPDEEQGEHWPRLLAWRRFCRDMGANWESIEEFGYSARYGFAGKWDRLGKLELLSGDTPWVLDVKSSAQKYRVVGLQTAAYRQIAAETRGARWALARRGSVRLHANGTYNFDEWCDPRDWSAFASLINLLEWKKNG